jgi:hypothetical protein
MAITGVVNHKVVAADAFQAFSGSAAGARLKETPLMLRQNQRFLGAPKGWIPPLGLLK